MTEDFDVDHEPIESPEALLRHLYEAHGVEEAGEVDPATAPVNFWVRRHAELERAARAGRPARPAPGPAPAEAAGAGRTGPPRVGRFEHPLVEGLVAALVGRGQDERRVRALIRGYVGPGGRRGEDAVLAGFVEPMVDAVAAALAGGRPAEPARPAPGPSRPVPDDDLMAIADVLQRPRSDPR